MSGQIRAVADGQLLIGRALHHLGQDIDGRLCHLGLAEIPLVDGLLQLLLDVTWLDQILSCQHLLVGVVGHVPGEPVGHHQPIELPLTAQHIGHRVLALVHIGAVDLVVGGHHRPGL
ncbi:hypothetical protein D3C80_1165970 [compost metagenome]